MGSAIDLSAVLASGLVASADVFHLKRDYGAVGDGSADDTAAVQAALDDCDASTYGGIVYVPPGTYKITAQLELKKRTILQGAGWRSQLYWPSDLGAGVYALNGIGWAAGDLDKHRIRDLYIHGGGPFTLGSAPRLMSGFRPGLNATMERVKIDGFYDPLVLVADHNVFFDCKITNGFYNVNFAENHSTSGNHQFYSCDLTGATKASVRVAGDNIMDTVLFMGGHVGFAPYGFLKTDKADGTVASKGFFLGSRVYNMAFESLGNGAIRDNSTVASSGWNDSVTGTVIEEPNFSWNNSYYDASEPRDWCVSVGIVRDSKIVQRTKPFTTNPTAGVGDIANNFAVEGIAPTSPVAASLGNGGTWISADAGGFYAAARSTITSGDILEWDAGGNGVARYGTSTSKYAGVAASSAASGAAVLVQQRGRANVTFAACTPTAGVDVCPDATTPYHANVGGTPVIGATPTGGTFTDGSLKGIYLKGY